MGRLMGAYDLDEDHDIPELNKCPDCQTYFEGDNCPICGKPCPENMRAGNRPAVKPSKKKKRRSGDTGRVTFVDWYHSWWFIILMMIIFPVVGIILLATSPHSRGKKILFVVILLVILALRYGGVILFYLNGFFAKPPVYVNTDISEADYRAKCVSIEAEELYRSAEDHKDGYVTITLTVEDRVTTYADEYYPTYYICGSGGEIKFLVRNCMINAKNFIKGDTLTVYGEFRGNQTVYTENSTLELPCIYMAYADIEKE